MIFILLGGKFVLFTFVVIIDVFGFIGLFSLVLIVYIFLPSFSINLEVIILLSILLTVTFDF